MVQEQECKCSYGIESRYPSIIYYFARSLGNYVANQNAFNPGKIDLPVAPSQSDLVLYI
jgi:hypothetical protein